MGLLWLVLGTTAVIFNSDKIINYGYLLIGMLYVGTYFFENSQQYLTIENGTISKNTLFPKKVNLNDITSIKKFAGDYIIKTDSTELKINIEVIDKNSLEDLNRVLDTLNLEAKQKTI
jgi:hypothetical protein